MWGLGQFLWWGVLNIAGCQWSSPSLSPSPFPDSQRLTQAVVVMQWEGEGYCHRGEVSDGLIQDSNQEAEREADGLWK